MTIPALTIFLLANILLWALWRRWLGAGNTGPRWIKVFVAGFMAAGPFLLLGNWIAAVVACATIAAYILPHHIYGKTNPAFRRYLLIGAIGYWLARKYEHRLFIYPPWLDGYSSYGELWLGGWVGLLFGGAVALLCY